MRTWIAGFLSAIGLLLVPSEVRAFVFERPVQCLAPNEVVPSAASFNPEETSVAWRQDSDGRYVSLATRWGSQNGGVGIIGGNYGLEFKISNYNYDDAATTSKGPAYVTAAGGHYYSTLPGFYLDSDFASAKNAQGEYREPQIGFGIEPGAGRYIALNHKYIALTRAVAGRGNKALAKVKQVPTKRIANGVGAFGVFQCADVPHYDVVKFQDGIYAPACFIRPFGGAHRVCSVIPEPCQGEFEKVGSGTTFFKDWRLGGVPGPVEWKFQAYVEADTMKIIRSFLDPYVDTGEVQGYHSGTFDYRPRKDGDVSLAVTSLHPGTKWHLAVSCPNYPLSVAVPK